MGRGNRHGSNQGGGTYSESYTTAEAATYDARRSAEASAEQLNEDPTDDRNGSVRGGLHNQSSSSDTVWRLARATAHNVIETVEDRFLLPTTIVSVPGLGPEEEELDSFFFASFLGHFISLATLLVFSTYARRPAIVASGACPVMGEILFCVSHLSQVTQEQLGWGIFFSGFLSLDSFEWSSVDAASNGGGAATATATAVGNGGGGGAAAVARRPAAGLNSAGPSGSSSGATNVRHLVGRKANNMHRQESLRSYVYNSFYSPDAFLVEQLFWFVLFVTTLDTVTLQRIAVAAFFGNAVGWTPIYTAGTLATLASTCFFILLYWAPAYEKNSAELSVLFLQTSLQHVMSAYCASLCLTLLLAETFLFEGTRRLCVHTVLTSPQRVVRWSGQNVLLEQTLHLLEAARREYFYFVDFYFFLAIMFWFSLVLMETAAGISILAIGTLLMTVPWLMGTGWSTTPLLAMRDTSIYLGYYFGMAAVIARVVPWTGLPFLSAAVQAAAIVLLLVARCEHRQPGGCAYVLLWIFMVSFYVYERVGSSRGSALSTVWGPVEPVYRPTIAETAENNFQEVPETTLQALGMVHLVFLTVWQLVSRGLSEEGSQLLHFNVVILGSMLLFTTAARAVIVEGVRLTSARPLVTTAISVSSSTATSASLQTTTATSSPLASGGSATNRSKGNLAASTSSGAVKATSTSTNRVTVRGSQHASSGVPVGHPVLAEPSPTLEEPEEATETEEEGEEVSQQQQQQLQVEQIVMKTRILKLASSEDLGQSASVAPAQDSAQASLASSAASTSTKGVGEAEVVAVSRERGTAQVDTPQTEKVGVFSPMPVEPPVKTGATNGTSTAAVEDESMSEQTPSAVENASNAGLALAEVLSTAALHRSATSPVAASELCSTTATSVHYEKTTTSGYESSSSSDSGDGPKKTRRERERDRKKHQRERRKLRARTEAEQSGSVVGGSAAASTPSSVTSVLTSLPVPRSQTEEGKKASDILAARTALAAASTATAVTGTPKAAGKTATTPAAARATPPVPTSRSTTAAAKKAEKPAATSKEKTATAPAKVTETRLKGTDGVPKAETAPFPLPKPRHEQVAISAAATVNSASAVEVAVGPRGAPLTAAEKLRRSTTGIASIAEVHPKVEIVRPNVVTVEPPKTEAVRAAVATISNTTTTPALETPQPTKEVTSPSALPVPIPRSLQAAIAEEKEKEPPTSTLTATSDTARPVHTKLSIDTSKRNQALHGSSSEAATSMSESAVKHQVAEPVVKAVPPPTAAVVAPVRAKEVPLHLTALQERTFPLSPLTGRSAVKIPSPAQPVMEEPFTVVTPPDAAAVRNFSTETAELGVEDVDDNYDIDRVLKFLKLKPDFVDDDESSVSSNESNRYHYSGGAFFDTETPTTSQARPSAVYTAFSEQAAGLVAAPARPFSLFSTGRLHNESANALQEPTNIGTVTSALQATTPGAASAVVNVTSPIDIPFPLQHPAPLGSEWRSKSGSARRQGEPINDDFSSSTQHPSSGSFHIFSTHPQSAAAIAAQAAMNAAAPQRSSPVPLTPQSLMSRRKSVGDGEVGLLPSLVSPPATSTLSTPPMTGYPAPLSATPPAMPRDMRTSMQPPFTVASRSPIQTPQSSQEQVRSNANPSHRSSNNILSGSGSGGGGGSGKEHRQSVFSRLRAVMNVQPPMEEQQMSPSQTQSMIQQQLQQQHQQLQFQQQQQQQQASAQAQQQQQQQQPMMMVMTGPNGQMTLCPVVYNQPMYVVGANGVLQAVQGGAPQQIVYPAQIAAGSVIHQQQQHSGNMTIRMIPEGSYVGPPSAQASPSHTQMYPQNPRYQ